MFFSPLLSNLLPQHKMAGGTFKMLCLTHGDTSRKRELLKSLDFFKIDDKSLTCYNMHDSMTRTLLLDSIGANSQLKQAKAHITKLEGQGYSFITFDQQGVSGHQNHRDCYTLLTSHLKSSTPLYILQSCMFLIKYLIPGIGVKCSFSLFQTFTQWKRSLVAMARGHKSQMVWYRYLWFMWSRYTWRCDFKRVNRTE